MWDDPFPTTDEMMHRQATIGLTALLLDFLRESEERRRRDTHEAAEALALRIVNGLGVLTSVARARLAAADTALREVRMAMPPSPVTHEGKTFVYRPPLPEREMMWDALKAAMDRYENACAKAMDAAQAHVPTTAEGPKE
mgnify:CR=1 FL=1